MTHMESYELLFRGASVGLLLFLAIRFAMMGLRGAVDRAGFLCCVVAAFHALGAHEAPSLGPQWLDATFYYLGNFFGFAFWLLALALFSDRARLCVLTVIPFAVIAVTGFFPELYFICQIVTVGLMLHIMVLALQDFDGDLVQFRRSFRVVLATLVPIFVITSIAGEVLVDGYAPAFQIIEWVKYFGSSLLFSLWLTRMERGLLSTPDAETAPRPRDVPVADRLDLDKLNDAVASGACFEPGLTIGALAHQLDMPEHRLRRLINRGLGYRNFAAFVNDHRIEEAKRRLADPGQAREQIIAHAFALGYNSLAPFNRAFRERTGQSPTAWRTAQLDQGHVPAE
ncbi:AraC family transcriptional regulator [Pontivivens insulae]|uniref:HTH araC/xylS-type domain-containing protein n=1 Tax=Pontivivens insulae TaxID=1639689 RepID=A0A2R8AB08_9RHOB|nr:AraC family transcriptional regulator [Pontivivens insulae]RED13329.1 AraC family transcriptional regulator [Pontivivens insulae]SPF29421.1 hypothetical protein POI8812_01730 [Pontivivens insulae]